MIRQICTILLLILLGAQPASSQSDSSHLRITLLTCGTGTQPWETFGHSAIRVADSLRGSDNVYNWGTFNGYDEDFLIKFTRGKLLYYLSYYPYRQFLMEYADYGRSVWEQELILSGAAKIQIYEFLQWNAREENKYYKYDFFFDNCATRIRDVFPAALGKEFRFGKTLPPGKKLSYRNIINQYFYRVHWQRFGVNILLGSRIDSIMSNEDIMFLPDYLSLGIGKSRLGSQAVSGEPVQVVPGSEALPAGVNGPLLLTLGILLLTVAGVFVPRLRALYFFMRFLLLFLTGFIGCFIIIMWLGTDHQACANNFNLLWALPTNLILAFRPGKIRSRYALMAILLIFISMLLHLFRIQELPLLELSPMLLSLLLHYGMIYRKH